MAGRLEGDVTVCWADPEQVDEDEFGRGLGRHGGRVLIS
jgi:hypothetical protein